MAAVANSDPDGRMSEPQVIKFDWLYWTKTNRSFGGLAFALQIRCRRKGHWERSCGT